MTPVRTMTTTQILTPAPEIKVFQPCGHINASNALEWRQQLIDALTSDSCPGILVDMGQVEALDSSGLMALVSALSLAQQHNQSFALCSVSPSIRIIFELTQLDRVFQITETPVG
jgi:anti-sigma B factor antagonist